MKPTKREKKKMVAYLEKVKEFLRSISTFTIKIVPRSKNSNVEALAKLASTKDIELLNVVYIKFLSEPIIKHLQKVIDLE